MGDLVRKGKGQRVEGAVGSLIAVGVDRGGGLDPLPYGPQTRLLESMGIRK